MAPGLKVKAVGTVAGFRFRVHFKGWADVGSIIAVIAAVFRANQPPKTPLGSPPQTSRSKAAYLPGHSHQGKLIALVGWPAAKAHLLEQGGAGF